MCSDPRHVAAFGQALLVRLGEGYRLTAPGIYVWEETLRDALASGSELGALPERRSMAPAVRETRASRRIARSAQRAAQQRDEVEIGLHLTQPDHGAVDEPARGDLRREQRERR